MSNRDQYDGLLMDLLNDLVDAVSEANHGYAHLLNARLAAFSKALGPVAEDEIKI